MNVLVGCECSGIVREAFRAKDHNAWSCDLKPAEDGSEYHIRGDVFEAIKDGVVFRRWDLLIAHPDCTYLTVSGLHWIKRRPERAELRDQAIDFVRRLWDSDIDKIALENPIGCLSTRWMKPTQIVQPFQYGEDASKATCLWLKNLPPIRPTGFAEPRRVDQQASKQAVLFGQPGKPRWSNQTDGGQNKLPPSPTRKAERSRTYPGISRAMAETWG